MPKGAHLVRHRGESPEADELAEVDAHRQGTGEAEAHQCRGVPVVLENPCVDDVAVQERSDQEQGPPLRSIGNPIKTRAATPVLPERRCDGH